MTFPPLPDFMNLPNLQDIDQLREEIAFNEIVHWMHDDENVMVEVVTAMHLELPLIDHATLIKAVVTGNPVDPLKGRSVVENAIHHAAINRANGAKIIQEEL